MAENLGLGLDLDLAQALDLALPGGRLCSFEMVPADFVFLQTDVRKSCSCSVSISCSGNNQD